MPDPSELSAAYLPQPAAYLPTAPLAAARGHPPAGWNSAPGSRRCRCNSNRTAAGEPMKNGAIQSSTKDLRKDLYAVARDAEALIRATTGVAGEKIQEARYRAEETL